MKPDPAQHAAGTPVPMAGETGSAGAPGDGDRGARFTHLLLANRKRVFGFIFALTHDRDAAEDIFQETSATLWKKFDSFEEGTDFAAWAMAVARFTVLNWNRRRSKLPLSLDDATLHLLADDAAAAACSEDDRAGPLLECLTRLSAKNRKLVSDRYGTGQSAREIALREDCTPRSIQIRLARIHGFLLDCIQRQFQTPPATPRGRGPHGHAQA